MQDAACKLCWARSLDTTPVELGQQMEAQKAADYPASKSATMTSCKRLVDGHVRMTHKLQ